MLEVREPEPGRARGRVPERSGGVWQRLRVGPGALQIKWYQSPGSHMTLVVIVVYLHDKLHEYNLMSNC